MTLHSHVRYVEVHLQDMKATYGNIVLLSIIEQVTIPVNNTRQNQRIIFVY